MNGLDEIAGAVDALGNIKVPLNRWFAFSERYGEAYSLANRLGMSREELRMAWEKKELKEWKRGLCMKSVTRNDVLWIVFLLPDNIRVQVGAPKFQEKVEDQYPELFGIDLGSKRSSQASSSSSCCLSNTPRKRQNQSVSQELVGCFPPPMAMFVPQIVVPPPVPSDDGSLKMKLKLEAETFYTEGLVQSWYLHRRRRNGGRGITSFVNADGTLDLHSDDAYFELMQKYAPTWCEILKEISLKKPGCMNTSCICFAFDSLLRNKHEHEPGSVEIFEIVLRESLIHRFGGVPNDMLRKGCISDHTFRSLEVALRKRYAEQNMPTDSMRSTVLSQLLELSGTRNARERHLSNSFDMLPVPAPIPFTD